MGLGVPELIVIFLIVVVLFGSNRLPQLGKGLGEALSNFKRGLSQPDQLEAAEEVAGRDDGAS